MSDETFFDWLIQVLRGDDGLYDRLVEMGEIDPLVTSKEEWRRRCEFHRMVRQQGP